MNFKLPLKRFHTLTFIAVMIAALIFTFYRLHAKNSISSEPAYACDEKDVCHKKVLLFRGDIPSNSVFRVAVTLARAKWLENINTVCMQSSGGVFSEALGIAQIIKFFNMNTCLALHYQLEDESATKVSGYCQSSCVWLILGGRHRYLMDDNLVLGFHASRDGEGEPVPSDLPTLKGKIMSLEDNAKNSDKLQLLAEWSFTQGHTSKTTNCTASELQNLYPYFTDLPPMRKPSDLTCGLLSPEEIKNRL